MEPTSRKLDAKFAVMIVFLLALALASVYAVRQAGLANQKWDQVQRTLDARIAAIREETQALGHRTDQVAAALQQQLQDTNRTVAAAAERRTEQLVGRLDARYRKQQSVLASELGAVKQAAGSTNEKVTSVAAEVSTVRGDVAQTRSELETARTELASQLRSVKGDLGVQSGLIATNARELAALRQLGERHYYEFTITKNSRPHKIASIAMVLRKTDPKRNRFTMDVLADDKKVEKKDKNLNEPVQFYVTGARQPYELVVNAVHKDRVVGYLAVPKVLEAAAR